MTTFLKKNNNAKTTLNGAITTGTSIIVSSASLFPTSGSFLCTIWDKTTYSDPSDDTSTEIVLVTGVSGNTFTVTRAQEGTLNVNHASGVAIEMLITAGHFTEIETAVNLRALSSDLSSYVPITNSFETFDFSASSVTARLILKNNGAFGSGKHLSLQTSTGTELSYLGSFGDAYFNVASQSTGNFRIGGQTDNSLFYAQASTNRIGIGTLTPAYKLDVVGDGNFSSSIRTPAIANLGSNGFIKTSSGTGTLIVDTNTYLTDAPSNGNQYARKDGAWDVVSSSGSPVVFTRIIFVDANGNDSTGDGTAEKPYATAQVAYDAVSGATLPTLIQFGIGTSSDFGGIDLSTNWNSNIGLRGIDRYQTIIGDITGTSSPGDGGKTISIPYLGQIAIGNITASMGQDGVTAAPDASGNTGGNGGSVSIYGDGTASISSINNHAGSGSNGGDGGDPQDGGNGGDASDMTLDGVIVGTLTLGSGGAGSGTNGGNDGVNGAQDNTLTITHCRLNGGSVNNGYANFYLQFTEIYSTTFDGSYTDLGGNEPAVPINLSDASTYTGALGEGGGGTGNPSVYDGGISKVLGGIDFIARSSDISTPSNIISSPPANGFYRIYVQIVITQAATASSTLPTAQVIFTEVNTNTSITLDVTPVLAGAGMGQTGVLTANTVGTMVSGVVHIFAKTTTAIQIQTTGYVSAGVTPMKFVLNCRGERCGKL